MKADPHPAFHQTSHRPWPLPDRPWILQQEWLDLLFLHWEIDPAELRPLIPKALEIDTFHHKTYLGVVPFSMRGVAPRGCPKPGFLSDFPEINVRAYVIHNDKPGVWFFSLDIPHRLPVWIARSFFHLPYFRAKMRVEKASGSTHYQSRYLHRAFDATYKGLEPLSPAPDSFETWATERYCLYSQDRRGQVYRGEIQHPPWPLQRARHDIRTNTMLDGFPVGPLHPSALFSARLPVVAYRIHAI